ncbi:hypothetical protein G9A89_012635 [Geosiphon pyriformis]|nr:hypothetical protein G9A89_012635 [Geosiphon pyriformis]
MSFKLFIGGLSWTTDDESLRSKFAEYGTVQDVVIIRDRETGRSRGFGFVTYSNNDEAENAIQSMDNQELDGRTIRVNMATERGGGGRGRGGGGYGGGGGGYGGGGGGGRW